jgi:NAD(P)-dependent dehydrogenase (short-subunit alcohol dehydrogenase family)
VSNVGSRLRRSKGAMDGLMRAVAIEHGLDSITINGVAPGWVQTGSSLPEELVAATYTPLGRLRGPREIAAAVAFWLRRKRPILPGRFLWSMVEIFFRKPNEPECSTQLFSDSLAAPVVSGQTASRSGL